MHEIVLRFEIMKNIAMENVKSKEKRLKQHWSLERIAEEVSNELGNSWFEKVVDESDAFEVIHKENLNGFRLRSWEYR